MRVSYLLLIVLLLAPSVAARQDVWNAAGVYSSHEFPDQTIPLGEEFRIGGSVQLVGTTDAVSIGVLSVRGCTVLLDEIRTVSAESVAWTSVLRQDDPTCNWRRFGYFNDTSLADDDRRTIASGTTVAFQMLDHGQDPAAGIWGAWFLPVFLLLLAVWFWVNGNSMPGVIAWLAALGLVVPGLPSSGRIWVILALGIVIPLHHYWSNIKIFVDKRRNGV